MLGIPEAMAASFAAAAVTFAARSVPFAVFSAGKTPWWLPIAARYLPALVMAALLALSLKETGFSVAALLALALTIALHVLKRNSLLSIFAGTAAYMILRRTFP